jgi:hypothetical protein
MRYMLLIYKDERSWDEMSTAEKGAIFQRAVEFSEALRPSGVYQGGEPLEPTTTATTVRLKHGKAVMTDGPFAETKEQLAGFYLIEARDLNDAVMAASKIPPAREGSIEVRPVRELSLE